MNKRTEGAWLISHTKKIQEVKESYEFEDIELAGKCGIFLSNLSASNEQSEIAPDKVAAIAKVSSIKKTEIDTIKARLKESRLIDISATGSIAVLGLTTSNVLSHTSDIFQRIPPSDYQRAALEVSDNISDLPKDEITLKQYISDSYKFSNTVTEDFFTQIEEIGFIDCEALDNSKKLYFNGNLFKRGTAKKTSSVLSSLSNEDSRKILDLDNLLTTEGCVTLDTGKKILGDVLLSKLQSIGMYDFNEVSNSTEIKVFITKPAAFCKYGDPFEEDALDLAKAFVSSLYYGANFSQQERGKISMLKLLLKKLLDGHEVGPATAIGEDYKILELKRVIQLRRNPGTNMYYMKLLKRDIGELAMQVLEIGDTTQQSVVSSNIYSGNVTNYVGPEQNRGISRKNQTSTAKKATAELLRTFRN